MADWLTSGRLGSYATAVTAMAGTLIALGIYTAASGSGLACAQQWPLCDGGVLPQTIPSFIEWFHRLWAMVTGFAIFGLAIAALRVGSRRAKLAAAGAAVLTPMQAAFGAVTVTLEGAIPGGYSAPVHAAHFLTGTSIFVLLTVTALVVRRETPSRPFALRVAAVGAVIALGVSRAIPVVPFSPAVQTVFFLVTLTTLGALLAAGRAAGGRRRIAIGAVGSLLFVTMLLGRDLVYYTQTVRLGNAVLAVLVAVAAVGLAVTDGRRSRPERDRSPAGD